MKKLSIIFLLLLNMNNSFAEENTSQTKKEDTAQAKKEESQGQAEVNRNVSAYHLVYLNAANFDFTNNFSTTYVGHLNVFAPVLRNIASKNKNYLMAWFNNHGALGINAGLFKINYNEADSPITTIRKSNVLMNPLKGQPDSGELYVRQFSRSAMKVKQSSYSMYLQPMWCLSADDAKNKILIHAHLELLVSRFAITTTSESIINDTVTFLPQKDTAIVFSSQFGNESTYTTVFDDSYLGLGITGQLSPWENGYLFAQITMGLTNRDATETMDFTPVRYRDNTGNKGFYLVRSYYTHNLSDASSIMIGADIRGYSGTKNHKWGTYVGLNIDIAQLAGLLTGSSATKDK